MDAELLSAAFVDLADTLVDDFDIIDFLHILTSRSVELLSASAAGVLLVSPQGELRAVAASSEAAGVVGLFELQNEQGPCLDCVRTGQAVTTESLAEQEQRWPQFAAAAADAGFGSVQALPMRLRDDVVGALNLCWPGAASLSAGEQRIAQALADVATIGLLQERSVRRSEVAAEQLQGALNSRVIIEQAKGKVAERLGVDMDLAFRMLREYARNSNQRLTDVARRFVEDASAEFPPPSVHREARPAGGQ
jgi:hypothetical protein